MTGAVLTRPKLAASGLDTVSFAWRSSDTAALDSFYRRDHSPTRGQGLALDQRGPGGERLLCWPRTGVLAIESRLSALLDADAKSFELVPAAMAEQGERVAREVAAFLLRAPVRGQSEVRRYDLTAEVAFDAPAEGHAFLRTLGGMCPPGLKASSWCAAGDPSVIETIYYRTPKRGEVRMRVYDKGVESGSDPPGTRIRLEAQMRPAKSARRSPTDLADADLRAEFGRTVSPYLEAGEVVAAGADGAVSHLAGQVARGEVSIAKAERMAGSIAFLGTYGRSLYEDRQGRRRLADLRDAGISLERTLPPSSVVPVGALLREAVEEFARA